MFKTFGRIAACLALAGGLLAFSGCNKHRDEEYQEQVYVAPVPPYPLVEDKTLGISYAVLQEGSVISSNIGSWHALSPELFTTLSGVTVKAPEPDKTYHAGYGFTVPVIEAGQGKPEHKMARISASTLVPKDLNGWVAVDQASLDALSKKYFESTQKK